MLFDAPQSGVAESGETPAAGRRLFRHSFAKGCCVVERATARALRMSAVEAPTFRGVRATLMCCARPLVSTPSCWSWLEGRGRAPRLVQAGKKERELVRVLQSRYMEVAGAKRDAMA